MPFSPRRQNAVVEPLEPRRLYSASALPSIHLSSATTLDSNSVTVNYTITGSAVAQPMAFDVYRSSTATLHAGKHTLLGATAIQPADLGIGSHV